jgi:hypothetical protein
MKSYTDIGFLSTFSSDHLSAEPKSDRVSFAELAAKLTANFRRACRMMTT